MQTVPQGLVMTGMAKLSRAILTVLLAGRHAALGGRTPRERAANLERIAAAYSRAELEQEKGIGPARAREVERWLRGQGLALRCPVSAIGIGEFLTVSSAEQTVGLESR